MTDKKTININKIEKKDSWEIFFKLLEDHSFYRWRLSLYSGKEKENIIYWIKKFSSLFDKDEWKSINHKNIKLSQSFAKFLNSLSEKKRYQIILNNPKLGFYLQNNDDVYSFMKEGQKNPSIFFAITFWSGINEIDLSKIEINTLNTPIQYVIKLLAENKTIKNRNEILNQLRTNLINKNELKELNFKEQDGYWFNAHDYFELITDFNVSFQKWIEKNLKKLNLLSLLYLKYSIRIKAIKIFESKKELLTKINFIIKNKWQIEKLQKEELENENLDKYKLNFNETNILSIFNLNEMHWRNNFSNFYLKEEDKKILKLHFHSSLNSNSEKKIPYWWWRFFKIKLIKKINLIDFWNQQIMLKNSKINFSKKNGLEKNIFSIIRNWKNTHQIGYRLLQTLKEILEDRDSDLKIIDFSWNEMKTTCQEMSKSYWYLTKIFFLYKNIRNKIMHFDNLLNKEDIVILLIIIVENYQKSYFKLWKKKN